MPEEKIKDSKPQIKKTVPGSSKPKPAEPIAKIEFRPVAIVPDELADPDPVASIDEINEKRISAANADGTVYKQGSEPVGFFNSDSHEKEKLPALIKNWLPDCNPEFPGGNDALMKFLSRHLNIPAELEADEKRMVKASFKVSGDGLVTWVEIVQSGGELFDKEVIRVCKRMPKWKPAIQNGIAVPVSYVLPVTFIRMDQ